jgi:hypothetical protein
MNKTFKKTLVAASVGAALAAGSMAASANSLLFPFFSTVSGAQSVITLSNTDGNWTAAVPAATAFNAGTGDKIHYVYNYGTACTHFDTSGTMSVNDTMSHSIAATSAGGFGKVVGSDKSTPGYFSLANQTGFVVVSNTTSTSTTRLQGSMAVIDPAAGTVVSYAGISNGKDTSVSTNEGDFSTIADVNFALTSLPDALVSTSWYAAVTGNMSKAIGGNRNWTAAEAVTNNGIVWDNDEMPSSGSVTKVVQCGGNIAASDLMNAAQAAAVGTNGSLIKVVASAIAAGTLVKDDPRLSQNVNADDTATGLVMMKIQTVKAAAGAPFAGKQLIHREAAGF